jgi:hypothetical protein
LLNLLDVVEKLRAAAAARSDVDSVRNLVLPREMGEAVEAALA